MRAQLFTFSIIALTSLTPFTSRGEDVFNGCEVLASTPILNVEKFERLRREFPTAIAELMAKNKMSEADISAGKYKFIKARSVATGLEFELLILSEPQYGSPEIYYFTKNPGQLSVFNFFGSRAEWGLFEHKRINPKQGDMFYLSDGKTIRFAFDENTFFTNIVPHQGSKVVDQAIVQNSDKASPTETYNQAILSRFRANLSRMIDNDWIDPVHVLSNPEIIAAKSLKSGVSFFIMIRNGKNGYSGFKEFFILNDSPGARLPNEGFLEQIDVAAHGTEFTLADGRSVTLKEDFEGPYKFYSVKVNGG